MQKLIGAVRPSKGVAAGERYAETYKAFAALCGGKELVSAALAGV